MTVARCSALAFHAADVAALCRDGPAAKASGGVEDARGALRSVTVRVASCGAEAVHVAVEVLRDEGPMGSDDDSACDTACVAEAGPATIADDGATVAEAMHRGLIACAPADSVGEVARIMIDNDIHAVVVMEGARALGVVSQTDVALARQGRTAEQTRALPVRDVMSPDCATCNADMLLSEAVSLMTGRRIHRLVVTEDDHPVGILSMTDVVRRLVAG